MSHDPVQILQDLIRCPSVTPDEGGALQFLQDLLQPAGFQVDRLTFTDTDTPDIENLFARKGEQGPHLVFAGHTDVVPTGDEHLWKEPPFSGTINNGLIFGRGAVDMKGGIAAFAAAALDFAAQYPDFNGQISFLITGDEEGPAINGTDKLLQWCQQRGETFDACILGEPTNPNELGDMIKIGRRGSVSYELIVSGAQGHVAYPHQANNPLPYMISLLNILITEPLDEGTPYFQASNLEVTSIETDNQAVNVIPQDAKARFNIRFNDLWSAERLEAELHQRLASVDIGKATYEIKQLQRVSHVFRTDPGQLTDTLMAAIEDVTGRIPELSTSGGTSDARFIKDYCEVIEFGLVGQTMHKIDECADILDVKKLRDIYYQFLVNYFKVI